MSFWKAKKPKEKVESPVTTLVAVPPEPIDLEPIENPKYRGYAVHHYPYSGWWVATHNNKLLKQASYSGVVEYAFDNGLSFAKHVKTEEDAWRLIDLHIEQQTRATVVTKTR